MPEKFDDLLGVKCFAEKRQALERIARARGVEAAELMRQAMTAIIEYACLYGDRKVPLDMAIAQRKAPENELAMAAEEPASYGPAEVEQDTPQREGSQKTGSGGPIGAAIPLAHGGSSKKKRGGAH